MFELLWWCNVCFEREIFIYYRVIHYDQYIHVDMKYDVCLGSEMQTFDTTQHITVVHNSKTMAAVMF